MKKLLLVIFFGLILVGCASKNSAQNGELMRIDSKCIPCNLSKYSAIDTSDLKYDKIIARECCANPFDASKGLKKVYIQNFNDFSEKLILIVSKSQKNAIYINQNFNHIFRIFLKKELESMGILLIDNKPSPYALKINVDLMAFKSSYFKENLQLKSQLYANLRIKNINKTKFRQVFVKQNVNFAEITDSKDAEIYVNLLVKQLTNKIALQIFNF